MPRSTGYRRRGRPYVDGYGTDSFVKKEVAAGGALYDMGVYHIAQVIFLEADEVCEVSYADRKGKYQAQQQIVLPRI